MSIAKSFNVVIVVCSIQPRSIKTDRHCPESTWTLRAVFAQRVRQNSTPSQIARNNSTRSGSVFSRSVSSSRAR
jgi:hypothetical protein